MKPFIVRGCIAASVPPAIMASASPYFIARKASPIACVEVEHAVTTGRHGPFALNFIAILPEAILLIIIGMKKGEMFLSVNIFSHCS